MNRTADMKRFGALTLCVVFASCTRAANPGIVPAAPAPGVASDHASGYKTIFSFDGADGSDPDVTLLSDKGQLYGTAAVVAAEAAALRTSRNRRRTLKISAVPQQQATA